ncbi:MAG: tetratricopeptide repeat protein [Planctomycetota bacterium]|nr:tetratricopeptide repeat protein [Planctomycetota bacterium]
MPAPTRLLVVLLLLLALAACYSPVLDQSFISYDDLGYVSENPMVKAGLTFKGLRWAFTAGEQSNWHPLTWLSHMLDCQLYGQRAGLHKLTSVILHAGNTLLVLAVLRRMTGSFWRSFLVAALFGLHPLRVQSVAWVSERKDVLSAFVGLLALWAYAGYTQRLALERYLLTAGLYVLSLLAKPMLVTLPFLLLLLDVWPLCRWRSRAVVVAEKPGPESAASPRPSYSAGRLILEKLPLLVLSIASSVVTFLVQHATGAVSDIEHVTLWGRVANSVWAYGAYLVTAAWPAHLTFFYPYEPHLAAWRVAIAAAALLGITVLALALAQRAARPWLAIGWLWYLGTLVPVIGIVQVGGQSMADRYTYIPMIGIAVMLAWSLPARWGGAPRSAGLLAAGVAAVLAVLGWRTYVEAGYWKDDRTLFARAVVATPDNYMAWINHGGVLGMDRRFEAAAEAFRNAVKFAPDYSKSHYNYGWALAALNKFPEAEAEYRESLRLSPGRTDARANLAAVLAATGRRDEALKELREAFLRDPNHAGAAAALAMHLIDRGLIPEAVPVLERAAALDPASADLRNNLAAALDQTGRGLRAIAEYQRAIAMQPENPGYHENFGNVLLRMNRFPEADEQFAQAQRRGARSVALCRKRAAALVPQGRLVAAAEQVAQACAIEPANHELRALLGGLLAQAGRYADAERELREALRLKPGFAPAEQALERLHKATGNTP